MEKEFEYQAQLIIWKAGKLAKEEGKKEATIYHLLYSILQYETLNHLIRKANLDPNKILESIPYKPTKERHKEICASEELLELLDEAKQTCPYNEIPLTHLFLTMIPFCSYFQGKNKKDFCWQSNISKIWLTTWLTTCMIILTFLMLLIGVN